MAKITKSTFKAFLRKNAHRLAIRNLSDFDPMTDCVQDISGSQFRPVAATVDDTKPNTLGIPGVWLVGRGRDSFQAYDRDGYQGIEVYNCCGHFIVATR
jgi:hypothetical protein